MAEETVLIRFKSDDEVSKTTKAVNDGLQDVGTNAGKASSSFSGMGSVMTGVMQGIGQGLIGMASQLGGKAISAVTDFVGGAIEEATAWNSVFAQTQAVIESTGGAAGITAEEMANLATNLSASEGASLFADDAILGAQNVLATFTKIEDLQFAGATEAILDMSQALGMDLDSAAMQVGKALNDPIKGIAALSRSGVQFTADQEAMIKAMVETGNVAGAQELMLAELNTQFGGSAAAAVNTYAGQQVILQEKMAGIQQTLGEALMPLMMQFGTFMSDTLVPILADVVGGIADFINGMNESGTASGIFDTLRNAIAAVPGVLALMGSGLQTVGAFFQPLADAVMGLVNVIVPAMVAMGGAIMEYLASPQVAAFIQTITTLFVTLAGTVQDILVLAFNLLTIAWGYLVSAFTTMWPYIQTILDTFLSSATIVIDFVTGLLTALGQLVKGDFSGAWTTLKTTVGTALTDLWGFFTKLKTNLTTFFDEVKPEVIKLGTTMIQGIADGIKSGAGWIKDALLAAARDAWSAVTAWFSGQGSDTGGDGGEGGNDTRGRSATAGGRVNSNGVVYNLTMHASYAGGQSESSLINDARAWMMTLGAE
jgi:hypothetical protein